MILKKCTPGAGLPPLGTKVYINGPDHMTKMADMAINREIYLSPEQ